MSDPVRKAPPQVGRFRYFFADVVVPLFASVADMLRRDHALRAANKKR